MANARVDDQFDLFGGFVAEIEGYVPSIAANLKRLLAEPGDEALLEESHRFAHTIKSSAGMMGMPELRKLAAPMEALLAKAYAGDVAITPEVVATVEGTLERVRRFLGGQSGGSAAGLITDNDQAYAGLRTYAPAASGAPSADAADRLAHLDDNAADELAMLLASGAPISDELPLRLLESPPAAEVAAPPPPAPLPTAAAEVGEPAALAADDEAAPTVPDAAADTTAGMAAAGKLTDVPAAYGPVFRQVPLGPRYQS